VSEASDSAASAVIGAARRAGLQLAVAESLTGGLLASEIVSVPGASAVFAGGIIAYDTSLKHSLLGVDAELLRTVGPVDAEVARQMARGVRRACALRSDVEGSVLEPGLGLATTGVAGPDPDPQSGQAAGTVWIAVSSRRGERAVRVPGCLGLTRQQVRTASVRAALDLVLEELGLPEFSQT